MQWTTFVLVALGAYLLGAIPVGYLAAKFIRKIDITKIGSGRIGGSNVLRAAGALPAALTILGDLGKGYGAVALALAVAPDNLFLAALAGVLAVVGHNWSVFLGFDGGVGTVTTFGAGLALVSPAALIAFACGLIVLAIWRYSSIGSLVFSFSLSLLCIIGAIWLDWSPTTILFAVGTAILSTIELRPNILRLRQGTERKLGQSIPTGAQDISSDRD